MRRTAILVLAGLAGSAVVLASPALVAKPVTYKLPPETAAFKPGPNLDLVKNDCTGCHSADYVATQPRGPKYGEAFWTTEVNKMIKLYGAPINQADVPKLVEYLTKTYSQ